MGPIPGTLQKVMPAKLSTCRGAGPADLLENLQKLDDVGMWRKPPKRLDFSQIIHLIQAIELVLHALYGHVFPVLDTLRLEHLREGALTLLRH